MHTIHIRKKSLARNYCPDSCWAAISIDSHDEWPKLYGVKRLGLLRLSFDDAMMPSLAYPDLVLFDRSHAKQIFDFVEQVKDKVDYLLVHCEAGKSRSPAIGGVLERAYIGSTNIFQHPNYRPNPLVLDFMRQEAESRGLSV